MAPAQLLCFVVNGRDYAVDVRIVREIRRWSEPTPLPDAPAFVRGAINLRGTIIPVYDLKARFGGGETVPERNHVLIVIDSADRLTGLLVDAVSDLAVIQTVTEIDRGADCFVDGVAVIDDKVVAILAIQSVVMH
jgi:purine-binding chemotaxis protein CheW